VRWPPTWTSVQCSVVELSRLASELVRALLTGQLGTAGWTEA
jgi:hypothetical protein